MKKALLLYLLVLPWSLCAQQKDQQLSLALTNVHSAYPFASFSKLFSGPYHPGVELGYGFNWSSKKRHDWFQAFRAGYFFHRFVQHGITLYTQGGYRYKPWKQVHFSGALGLGYLHSIPATGVYELNDDGAYEKAKGLGRAQLLVNLSIAGRYLLCDQPGSAAIFLQYTQQLQAPFIKSYVPLLPYNQMAVGVSIPFKPKK